MILHSLRSIQIYFLVLVQCIYWSTQEGDMQPVVSSASSRSGEEYMLEFKELVARLSQELSQENVTMLAQGGCLDSPLVLQVVSSRL